MGLSVTLKMPEGGEVFWASITHNLADMAAAAHLYEFMWTPEQVGVKKAGQLVAPLTQGMNRLMDNAQYYISFNPANSWGTYEQLLQFVRNYLDACEAHPDAGVSVTR